VIGEGYIKFHCILEEDAPPPIEDIYEMNECRNTLYRMGLIGINEIGIGYGNVSIRNSKGDIIITGSRTGGKEILNPEDYCKIESYSFWRNEVICRGKVKASSETLTHAAMYECSPDIGSVIHIHSLLLWSELLFKLPTTSMEVEYGTPEMAYEIKRIYNETALPEKKVLVMGGHVEGLIAFGKNIKECYSNLIDIIGKVSV
jgi:L-ribulose-5-phosphate 4-epimerase